MKILEATTLTLAALGLSAGLASGQYDSKPADKAAHDHGKASAQAGQGMKLTASLVDAEAKARQQTAIVKVDVAGVKLTDPALSMEKPIAGQGHLHYQVDDGPVIATTTPKLSFHGLKPGAHRVKVVLAANDHSPLGPEQTLNVTIPTAAATAQ